MRTRPLFRLLLPAFIAMPLLAQAEWPAGTRATYMDECLATARQNVDSEQAEKHCQCGADVIEKNFSSAEIKTLNDRQTPPPADLRERLIQAVAACSEG